MTEMKKTKISRQYDELVLNQSTTSAFTPEGRKDIQEVMQSESAMPGSSDLHVYTRYANPTVSSVEKMIAHLEHPLGGWAQLVPSGMAAIHAAIGPLIEKSGTQRRSILHPNDMYGGTLAWLKETVDEEWGLNVIPVDITRINQKSISDHMVDAILKHKPGIVLFEPITNPQLRTLDVERITKAAKDVGTLVVADNTIATCLLFRPLLKNVDLVVHSVTKYISGHGSMTAGVVIGRSDEPVMLPERCNRRGTDGSLEAVVRNYVKKNGANFSPSEAFRLADHMKTFQLRVAAANRNAFELSATLARHPAMAKVWYPGLAEDPCHEVAVKQFEGRGFGAMIAIETKGEGSAERLLDALDAQGIRCRLTLGDMETTVLSVPKIFGAIRFAEHPEMIRVSVGTEPTEHLLSIFMEALETM